MVAAASTGVSTTIATGTSMIVIGAGVWTAASTGRIVTGGRIDNWDVARVEDRERSAVTGSVDDELELELELESVSTFSAFSGFLATLYFFSVFFSGSASTPYVICHLCSTIYFYTKSRK